MKLINDVGVKNSQFWCDNEVKKYDIIAIICVAVIVIISYIR